MILNYYLENRPTKKGECPIRLSAYVIKTRINTNIGYSVHPDSWDAEKQRMKPHKQNSKKQTSAEINEMLNTYVTRLTEFEKDCETTPTLAQIKVALQGKYKVKKKTVRKNMLALYDQFILEESIAAQWSDGTLQTIRAFRHHIENFCRHKSLAYFNDDGVNNMLSYFRNECNLTETSVEKYFKILRWFLRWTVRKGYVEQKDLYRTTPKIKLIEQPVIYLTKEELLKLYKYQVSKNGSTIKLTDIHGNEYEKTISDAAALEKTRDLFCFCAFTSLRYSDMAKVKRTDIFGDILYTTTQKTGDRLPIDLNAQAKAILAKYKKEKYPGDLALPVISNQKMNDYLKDLGELCEFKEPVTKTFIRGGERVTEIYPKYQLIGTHAARRTFICFALATGIPPQVVMKWTGHSDYKSMRPYIEIAAKTKSEAMKKISDAWGE